MKQAADSSIAIAALLADHQAHDSAEDALSQCEATIAHVAAESYSVLTRLPPPHRLKPSDAGLLVARRLVGPPVALDAEAYRSAPVKLAAIGIAGGATYDGLIALTVLEHGLELVSRDRRAARTYRALGVPFLMME